MLFHSCSEKRKCNRPSVGPLKLDPGHVSDDPVVMANCFVQQFASVYSTSDPYEPFLHHISDSRLCSIVITPELVADVLNNLDPNTSMGKDGIHPKLVMNYAYPWP